MHYINPGFSHIGSYADALAKLNKNQGFTVGDAKLNKADAARPIEQQSYRYAERALDGKKRHMSLRRLACKKVADLYDLRYGRRDDGCKLDHIAFKLYDTDVVIWREDDAVLLQPYQSISTNVFANMLTPSNMYINFSTNYEGDSLRHCDHVTTFSITNDDCCYRWYSTTPKRVYRMSRGCMLLRPTEVRDDQGAISMIYTPDEQDIEPFEDIHIQPDRAARARRKYGVSAFSHYIRAYIHMAIDAETLTYVRWNRGHDVFQATWNDVLADQSLWPKLVAEPRYWPPEYSNQGWGRPSRKLTPHERGAIHAKRLIALATHFVYRVEDCYESVTRMWVTSTQEAEAVLKRHAAYVEMGGR